MLQVNKWRVRYGEIEALKGVTLEVGYPEVVSILGANGAGKTTLLKSLVGLLRPCAGAATFDGTDLVQVPSWKMASLGIGYVPEGRRIFPQMTVRENLELGFYASSKKKNMFARIEQMYALFPRLKEREGQAAALLSGGEQQMLAIARALMTKPRLILMDEPSMGLSPLMTEQIYEYIAAIKEHGTSILLVEQNTAMALEVADRGYVLQNGEVVLSGKSDELLRNDLVREAYLGI